VRALEAIIGKQRTPANIIPGGPPLASRGTSSPEAEEDKGQMLLKLTKWSASIKEGQYSTPYYEINYSLQAMTTNRSKRLTEVLNSSIWSEHRSSN